MKRRIVTTTEQYVVPDPPSQPEGVPVSVAGGDLEGVSQEQRGLAAMVAKAKAEWEAYAAEVLCPSESTMAGTQRQLSDLRAQIPEDVDGLRADLLADVALGAKTQKDLERFDAGVTDLRVRISQLAAMLSALESRVERNRERALELARAHESAVDAFLLARAERLGREYKEAGGKACDLAQRIAGIEVLLRKPGARFETFLNVNSLSEFKIPRLGLKCHSRSTDPDLKHDLFQHNLFEFGECREPGYFEKEGDKERARIAAEGVDLGLGEKEGQDG